MKNILSSLNQNHPKGLFLLFFLEMWERFSYYGMRALLILYMVENLLFSTQKAGNIYGFYTGLVYLTPILGGYLADKYLGQRKAISLGAGLMCAGMFLLFFSSHLDFKLGHYFDLNSLKPFFFLSLLILITANGFFKPNISSLLGLIYKNQDDKKDSAYTVFYLGINLGAFFSPLICASLALKYGYNYGFLASGIGILIGFIIYKSFENKLLNNYGINPANKTNNAEIPDSKLTKRQIKRIKTLFILMFFTIVFWTCFEQAGSSLTLFAQYSTKRTIFNHEIPAGWFQSLNPLFIMILAPLSSWFWIYLKNKNSKITSVDKFFFALVLISFSFLLIAFAGYFSNNSTVSSLWLVGFYFVATTAELCISPIGLSLVSKLAPEKFLSLLMGFWFLTSFFGNTLAGFWGGKYGSISNFSLFSTLCAVSFLSSIIFAFLMPKIKKNIGKI